MGGGASKKKKQKQKTKRATYPANDAINDANVNAPQQKEIYPGSPPDDDAPLENKRPQNLNSTGQVEQLNVGMVERSADVKDYENNTEVIPQAGVHQFNRSEREQMGEKVTVSHLIEKDKKRPQASKVKQKPLIMTTGKQIDTIALTNPEVHSQHPPVKPICPPSDKMRYDIEENVLNQNIIPNIYVPAKHTEGNDQPEDGNKSAHHTEKRDTTKSTLQQTGKQADASTLNKPNVLSRQPTITPIRLSCHKEQKVLETNQNIIPDTSITPKRTQSNQPEDGSKSSHHTETRATIQSTPQQTGNQDSVQQSPITLKCPLSHKERNNLEENVLNQNITLNICVPTKYTEEANQPEDGGKRSHQTGTRATIPHTPQQIGQQANRSTLSKPEVRSQQPPLMPTCIPSNKEEKDLQENVTHETNLPKHTEETKKKQPKESSNHTETMATIQGTPGQDTAQPPSLKTLKDLEKNVLNQDINLNNCVSTKCTEETDQPEDGSKSSHLTETRATTQGISQQSTETDKGETKTHLTEISIPSTHKTCPQGETAPPQLLEVSTEDAKSPTQQQALGDSNPKALMLNEKMTSTHDNHLITENKTYKLDEAENQATKTSGNSGEPVCDNSGIPLFTVNQRCPNKVLDRHNHSPAPKASRRFDDFSNYLAEYPWITTAKVAAFLALRKFEDTLNQGINLNICVPTQGTEEIDQPEDSSKSSHHTETRVTTQGISQLTGQQADTSTFSKPDVHSQQPSLASICIHSNQEQKDFQENVTPKANLPNIDGPTKHTEETKKQPEESSNLSETRAPIQGTPGKEESAQPPSLKEQKDLEKNVPNQGICLNNCGSTKCAEETDQPEYGSKSSHLTETRATTQSISQQSTETDKGETKTHLTEISIPSTHETCPQRETAPPQLLEVRNGSNEDAKSPTQQQAPGYANLKALILDEKLISTHDNHLITENKIYKIDEAESQTTKNSESSAEPVCDNSGIPLFTVNQRCPNKACGRHNPGQAPKVSRRFAAQPNYLSEAPWITTAKIGAFVALRKFEDSKKQMED